MRLVVSQADKEIGQYRFTKGPVHIGRHEGSQVLLSDLAVSRHHAVFYNTDDGKWILEDLNSANKTYLNEEQIQKAEVENGSIVRIAGFLIEVTFDDETADKRDISMEDTLTKTAFAGEPALAEEGAGLQVITRRLDFEHAPDMRLPAQRMKDFMHATEVICKAKNMDEMINSLLEVASSQFSAFHCWCALRNLPVGSMSTHGGRRRDGVRVQFGDIGIHEKITEAVEKKHFLLLPRLPVEIRDKQKVNSAMIGPILCKEGCLGVLYLDNDMSHEHFSLSDLDYLMLLTIHTAAILNNF